MMKFKFAEYNISDPDNKRTYEREFESLEYAKDYATQLSRSAERIGLPIRTEFVCACRTRPSEEL